MHGSMHTVSKYLAADLFTAEADYAWVLLAHQQRYSPRCLGILSAFI